MSRFSAGLLAGGIGALIMILMGFAGQFWIILSLFVGLLLSLVVGLAAGFFVSKNPTFASRTAGSGALAGLIAGAFLLIGQIIGGIIAANQPDAQAALQGLQTTSAGSSLTPSQLSAVGIFTFAFFGCIFGLLSMGTSTGLGAAGGAIGGRNNRSAVNYPYGYGMPPIPGSAPFPPQPGAPPYPQQYPPPQQPQSPYGSLAQGQYANPPQPDVPPYPPQQQ